MFFLRQIVMFLFSRVWQQYTMARLKHRGMLAYLKALQGLRRGIMGVILFACILQLMVIGFIGMFVTSVFLFDLDFATRTLILFIGFSIFALVPFALLVVMLSERMWFKASGAQEFFRAESQSEPQSQTGIPKPA